MGDLQGCRISATADDEMKAYRASTALRHRPEPQRPTAETPKRCRQRDAITKGRHPAPDGRDSQQQLRLTSRGYYGAAASRDTTKGYSQNRLAAGGISAWVRPFGLDSVFGIWRRKLGPATPALTPQMRLAHNLHKANGRYAGSPPGTGQHERPLKHSRPTTFLAGQSGLGSSIDALQDAPPRRSAGPDLITSEYQMPAPDTCRIPADLPHPDRTR